MVTTALNDILISREIYYINPNWASSVCTYLLRQAAVTTAQAVSDVGIGLGCACAADTGASRVGTAYSRLRHR